MSSQSKEISGNTIPSVKNVSAKRKVLINGVANWSGFVAQVAVTFVTAPIIVHGLGDERYGIWSLVESVLAYLMLLDLGLTASVVRYTSKYQAINDMCKRDQILSTSFVLFAFIGLIAFLTTLFLSLIGPFVFGVSEPLTFEAKWLFLLLGVNLAIGIPMNVLPGILAGLGRYPVSTAIRTTSMLSRAALIVTFVISGGGLIAIGVIVTAVGIVEHLAMFIAVRICMPDFRFSFSQISWTSFREIRGYSTDAFIIAINNRIGFKTDAVVIGIMLGPLLITPFAVANKLVSYATDSIRAFTQVLTPAVSELDAKQRPDSIRRLMINGTRYVLWAILPMELGLIILGKPFLNLWMGERLAVLSFPVLVILSLPLFTSLSQSIATRILFGTGEIRWLARAGIVQSVSNIVLSVLLARPLGIVGVAIGTAVPFALYNIAVEKHVCKKLGIGMGEYFAKAWAMPLVYSPVLFVVWFGYLRFVPITWMSLTTITMAGLIAYVACAVFVELDRQQLAKFWKRFRSQRLSDNVSKETKQQNG